MPEIAMFPLGSVLLPTMVLPLHIFEPRYRLLVADCLSGEQEFGVCLIERGSEVGGGDTRTDVGTVAQIVDAEQFSDGRWAIAAVGTRRFRIEEWLEENPYPRARISYLIEEDQGQDLTTERDNVVDLMERVRKLHLELTGQVSSLIAQPVDADPALASFQLAGAAPLGPFDLQQLLATPDTATRLDRLANLLGAIESDLRAQQP